MVGRHVLLLYASPGSAVDGVAPFHLKWPLTAREVHQGLKLPCALVLLAPTRIVPVAAIRIRDRLGEFLREHVRNTLDPVAIAIAAKHWIIASREPVML